VVRILKVDINDLDSWYDEMNERIVEGARFIQDAFLDHCAHARSGYPPKGRPKIFVHWSVFVLDNAFSKMLCLVLLVSTDQRSQSSFGWPDIMGAFLPSQHKIVHYKNNFVFSLQPSSS
jgi:hypothetical protein